MIPYWNVFIPLLSVYSIFYTKTYYVNRMRTEWHNAKQAKPKT